MTDGEPHSPLSMFSAEQRQAIAEGLRRKLPPNWPSNIELDKVIAVVQDEGIPLVWVPREEIVVRLLMVADRPARAAVLVEHVDQVLDDCGAILQSLQPGPLRDQTYLTARAIEALGAGHFGDEDQSGCRVRTKSGSRAGGVTPVSTSGCGSVRNVRPAAATT